jgi:DNA-directed RNA polymerase subunit M/transcription elongation factor TFIIS
VAVISLNSCPRCQGDMVLDNKDEYGWYEQCLQCGYLRDLEVIVQVERQPAAETKVRHPKRIARR